MVNDNLKGSFLLTDEEGFGKNVYIYPDDNYSNVDNNDNILEKEKQLENEIANAKFECKGKLIKVYKNNLVIEFYEDKGFIKENKNVIIRIIKLKKAYECSAEVLGVRKEDKRYIAVLSIPIIRRQIDRRRFFRIAVQIRVRYFLLPKGEYRTVLDIPRGCFLKTKKCRCIDISAGGIKILTEENMDVGKYVLINIFVPYKSNILCKVVRSEVHKASSKFIISMEYVYIDEQDRDKIVRFVIKNESVKIRETKESE